MVKLLKFPFSFLIMLFLFLITGSSCKRLSCGEGERVEWSASLPSFRYVVIGPNVQTEIIPSTENRMRVNAMRRMLDWDGWHVSGDTLYLYLSRSCMWYEEATKVKVRLMTDSIKYIRNASEWTVSTRGFIHTDTLTLVSEGGFSKKYLNTGDFRIKLVANRLTVISNGYSLFRIQGYVHTSFVGFYGGLCRMEAKDLLAEDVFVFHRSANDVFIRARNRVRGKLLSTGNLYIYGSPRVVEVEQHYTGRVILKE